MTANLAVCYVADVNFLVGTLISLRSLRRFVPPAEAEIHVFFLNPDMELLERIRHSVAGYSASVHPLIIDDKIDLAAKKWNKTHVPHAALGRFYLEPYLPAHISRILYIDGDTLVVRDPKDLLDYMPPPDGLAAADDISYFARNDWSRFGARTRSYFSGLGIDGSRGYLNSGLLLARRGAWKRIMDDAIDFFDSHSDRCRYHDQSALNAVVATRRVRLSPTWNFQTPFCFWNVAEEIAPHILHFTEYPKPWMGATAPWSFVQDLISEAAGEFTALSLPHPRLSNVEAAKYNRQNLRRAWRLSTYAPLRLHARRREIRRLAAIAAL
ncbi:MAG: glycosyltransferase [Ancalomicrobiaceae bacterium]|nr:glycosyltransferase [Ancalomicrobiaceae bacterium]